MRVNFYETEAGRKPVAKWLGELDGKALRKVQDKLEALGGMDFTSDHRLPKDVVHLRHKSRDQDHPGVDVYEYRIDERRVYFSKQEGELLLVAAGDTDSATRDIIQAFSRAADHSDRKMAEQSEAVVRR